MFLNRKDFKEIQKFDQKYYIKDDSLIKIVYVKVHLGIIFCYTLSNICIIF